MSPLPARKAKARFSLAFVTVYLVAMSALGCKAQKPEPEDLRIRNAWIRPVASGVNISAGYMDIHNYTTRSDRLLSVSCECAGVVEIHATQVKNLMMSMQKLPDLEIPAGGRVSLAPGGFHLMFIDLKRPLVPGDIVEWNLRFEGAGPRGAKAVVGEPTWE